MYADANSHSKWTEYWGADHNEVCYSILPILIGDGISFFERLDRDIALHLAEVKAYNNGMVELFYEVRGQCGGSRTATT